MDKIYTDYNGWWSSDSIGIYPDNSHNLLGFSIGGIIYSTGVNDALLDSKNILHIPQNIEAMATTYGVNCQYVGVGYNYGGIGNVLPIPVNKNGSYYLSDGSSGLDLGTAIFNSTGSIIYTIPLITPESIGDGIPDIFVTQMGDPSAGSHDKFKFLDINGNIIGNEKIIDLSNIKPIGKSKWKFYTPTSNTFTYNSSLSGGTRDIRLLAYELSDFGINETNCNQITKFVHTLSGSSDQSFIAYNKKALTVLPVEFNSFEAVENNGVIDLKWITISEKDNDFFTIEKSIDGSNWEMVVVKKGSGNSLTKITYNSLDTNPYRGVSYYRISQTDFNGKSKTFKTIVSVHTNEDNKYKIIIYPNPSKHSITIEGLISYKETYSLYNSIGNNISDIIEIIIINDNTLTIDISNLESGIYFIRLNYVVMNFIVE